jgi:hypothetical protein
LIFCFAGKSHGLDKEVLERVGPAVLCISNSEDGVLGTAIVWDYTPDHVLLLTNYHTWDIEEFKYCFPLNKKTKKSKKPAKGKRKKKADEVDEENEVIKLHNEFEFKHEFVLTADLFHSCNEENDFAVLMLSKDGFTMKRIPVSLEVTRGLKIHSLGYVGHSNVFNSVPGEITSLVPRGFTTNVIFAPGYILADYIGRAVGYMGGNWDFGSEKNSQHQSFAFPFGPVILATGRQTSPTNSPSAK